MIYLYSGTPGSGKSLHAAQQIYEALHVKKRLVITNFPVNSYYSRFGKDKSIINKYSDLIVTNNQELHPEWLKFKSAEWFKLHPVKNPAERLGKILLVLDEAELIFNSRTWNRYDRAEWLSFFNLHRHFGFDVILIAQFDKMLDSQIRPNIEVEFMHRQFSSFGLVGKMINLLMPGGLFAYVALQKKTKTKTGTKFFRCRKKYYELYDSFALFAADGTIQSTEKVTADYEAQQKRIQTGKSTNVDWSGLLK